MRFFFFLSIFLATGIIGLSAQDFTKIPPGTGQLVQCPDPFPLTDLVPDHYEPTAEHFFVYVPAGFDPSDRKTKYGMVVFINGPDGDMTLPAGWDAVLDKRKLFFVAPSNVGRGTTDSRRLTLPLIAALTMKRYFPIDDARVYVSGLSGGARVACYLAFQHPTLFRGTIQNGGTEYFRSVSRVAVTQTDVELHPGSYGYTYEFPNPLQAKNLVRFVLITGPKDYRHNFILDFYNGGFVEDGYSALLLDVPGMGAEICSGDTLEKALEFIESKTKTAPAD